MDALLALFDDDLATAQRTLERKRRGLLQGVRGLCARFSRGIAWPIDADDVVQDTLIRVAELALRHTLTRDNIDGYLYRTARFIVREHYRRLKRGEKIGETEPPAPEVDERLTRGCAGRCLDALDVKSAGMLAAYYTNDTASDRRNLATRLEVSEVALRVRVHAARRRLQQCWRRCERGEGVHV